MWLAANDTRSALIPANSAMPPQPDRSPNGDLEVVIRVRDLVVELGNRIILDHLNIEVYRGEILGLVGASGSGKSVLARAIIGLLPKRLGTIEVFGENFDELPPIARRALEQRWGIMFQHGALFSSLTVKQNIQVPMREFLDLSDELLTNWPCSKSRWWG